MLGDKIRRFRKEKSKTLNEIAEITGLSASYISQLERGNIEPSLSALRKIAVALAVPVYLFMEDDPTDEHIQRKDKRILMSFPNSTITFEIASAMPNKSFEPSMLVTTFTLSPHSYDVEDYLTHESDEISLITNGELTITSGSQENVLKEGDTIFIKGNTPHRYYNHTDSPVSGYVILSPAAWPGKH